MSDITVSFNLQQNRRLNDIELNKGTLGTRIYIVFQWLDMSKVQERQQVTRCSYKRDIHRVTVVKATPCVVPDIETRALSASQLVEDGHNCVTYFLYKRSHGTGK